jgi:hypothetical protein
LKGSSPIDEDSDGMSAFVSPRVEKERDKPFVPSFMRNDSLRKVDSAPVMKKNVSGMS